MFHSLYHSSIWRLKRQSTDTIYFCGKILSKKVLACVRNSVLRKAIAVVAHQKRPKKTAAMVSVGK